MVKDITKKKLEEHEDVFADIFNALVFKGKEVIKAEDLTLLPTTEHHADEKGVLRERTRDVFMENKKQGVRYLLLGGENQRVIDMVKTRASDTIVLYKSDYDDFDIVI